MQKIFFGVLLALTLTACVSKYRVDNAVSNSEAIDLKSNILVNLPRDGQFGATAYPRSGVMAAEAIKVELATRGANVVVAEKVVDLETSLEQARANKHRYLLFAQLLHWEDRATQWSGRPDRITMRYDLIDVVTGKSVANTVLSASSKWATLGGDHPEDLVPGTIKIFLDSVRS